jgi:hypothetical protein
VFGPIGYGPQRSHGVPCDGDHLRHRGRSQDSAAHTANLWAGWGCTVHGTERRRSWPGRFPCPLTHGNKRHINDPSGRSAVSRLRGLTISARPGRRTQPLRHFARFGYPVYD